MKVISYSVYLMNEGPEPLCRKHGLALVVCMLILPSCKPENHLDTCF